MPKLNPVKSDFEIKHFRDIDRPRKPTQVSLGPHFVGAAMPHPDSDPHTAAAGVCARFGRAPPEPDPKTLDRFERFVGQWLSKNLVPLPPDTDVSFDTWIAETPYPEWRKKELRSAKVENIFDGKKYFKCKSFIKDECYPSYKHARGINSRTDPFKCAIGPWFKVIEKVLFRLPYFIKKVPVSQRAQFIKDRLFTLGACYLTSDYTSFEALFTSELMKKCEFQLYKYMTQFIPNHDEFWRMLDEVLAATNSCAFRDFLVKIKATRMSGEMCTSLGNGFSNLMFILFVCSELGSTVDGVVEGDDGLFVVNGPVPTEADFAKLGLRIKLQVFDRLSDASFCGLVFDEEDCVNVTDPLPEIVSFGLGTSKYMSAKDSTLKSLLRCKSLSMVHQYSGCPILQEIGLYGIRVTKGIDHRTYMNSRHVCTWERDQLIEASRMEKRLFEVVREPPRRTRLLVERLYGISIERQLAIEQYFRQKEDTEPIRLPLDFPNDWETYFVNFSTNENVRDIKRPMFEIPRNPISKAEWTNIFASRIEVKETA